MLLVYDKSDLPGLNRSAAACAINDCSEERVTLSTMSPACTDLLLVR